MPDSLLILTAEDIRRALPYPIAIDAMKQAFAAQSSGRAVVPQRSHLPVARNSGLTLAMPAFVDDPDPRAQALGLKVVSIFGRNAERGLAAVQAAVLVLDPETGRPVALLEGATLTAIRTAAASAAATDLLARRSSRVVAIFGAGTQAAAHAEALSAVRPLDEIRLFNRNPARAIELADRLARTPGISARVIVAPSAREAVRGADIVCTTTNATAPLFDDADLAPGTHLNAIGAYTPAMCEVPPETVARAVVVVDSREAAREEAGDLIQPLRSGRIDVSHVRGELGELILGQIAVRKSDDDITLFKSVGIAAQDTVAARVALDNATRSRLGTRIPW